MIISVDSHLSCPDALLSTALMAAFSRFVHPEILNFVSTPRMVRVEAAGDGARERGVRSRDTGRDRMPQTRKGVSGGSRGDPQFGTRVRTERIVGAWPVICTI